MSSEKQQEIKKNYSRAAKSSAALKKNLVRRKKVSKLNSKEIQPEILG